MYTAFGYGVVPSEEMRSFVRSFSLVSSVITTESELYMDRISVDNAADTRLEVGDLVYTDEWGRVDAIMKAGGNVCLVVTET